jgi:DNA-directed RNA polymerase specialized sigma24 family protein
LFPSATLAEFYRFALLLTGSIRTAERIMAETLHQVEAQLAEFRHETGRQAWLALRIRQRCLRENAVNGNAIPRLLRAESDERGPREILRIEAFIVAQRFSTLPEPERSALALFYLELFDPEEIARLLKLSLEELGAALSRARAFLAVAMEEGPA